MAAPYATITNLIDYYDEAELNKFRGITIAGTTCAELTAMLDRASNLVETYCRAAGFSVPLSATPAIITDIVMKIVFYRLWVDRTPTHKAPEHIKDDYDAAIKWLEDLVKGDVELDVSTEPDADTTTDDLAEVILTVDDLDMTMGKGDLTRDELGSFKSSGPNNSSG